MIKKVKIVINERTEGYNQTREMKWKEEEISAFCR